MFLGEICGDYRSCNAIFNEKSIQDDIDRIKEFHGIIDEIKKKIEQEGLAIQKEEVKNRISVNTVKIEHLKRDIDRKNNDYLRYLSALKSEREAIQESVSKVINQEVKINITFNF